jgi:hypothetical protein
MKLTEENFVLYAMHHYDNPQCQTIDEFNEDLKRFLYIKKLLYRYAKTGDLKERLILNHIIVLSNLFGEALCDMLYLKIEKEFWPVITTFLIYLNKVGERVGNIVISDIPLDKKTVEELRKI